MTISKYLVKGNWIFKCLRSILWGFISGWIIVLVKYASFQFTYVRYQHIKRASIGDYGTYHICEQRRLSRACAIAYMKVWANLAVTKLFGLRQDWPCLKNIYKFIIFLHRYLTDPYKQKIIWFRSLRLIVSCCKHVDPTVAILVQRSMWSRVSLSILAGNLSRDHTAAKQMSVILE